MKKLIYTLDKAQAVAFALVGLGCIYGVIAKGAWMQNAECRIIN